MPKTLAMLVSRVEAEGVARVYDSGLDKGGANMVK